MRGRYQAFLPLSLVVSAGLASVAMADPPVPQVPAGNDIFGSPNQGPGAYPGSLSGANFYVHLPQNTVQGRFGSNALLVGAIYSGPFPWTAGNLNEGDFDVTIGVATPGDVRSFPTWSGWDAFRQTDAAYPSNPMPAALPLPASQWPDSENWGRLQLTGGQQYSPPNWAWGTHPAHGVILATPASNGRDNHTFDRDDRTTPMGTMYLHTHVSDDGGDSTGRGYNPINGEFRGTGMYVSTFVVGERPGNQDEGVCDVSIAYFPYEEGWIGGFVDTTDSQILRWRVRDGSDCATPGLAASVVSSVNPFDARHLVTLPGMTPSTGMLLAQSCYDDNDFATLTGVLPQDDNWATAQRYDNDRDTTGNSFAPLGETSRFVFVYVPYDCANLVGGQIAADGSRVHAAGDFTLLHTSPGQYHLRIPGKTNRDGALLVTSAGAMPNDPGLPDRTFYSWQWESEGQAFIIESRELTGGNNTWGEDYPLRDSGFYFLWVDFTTPPCSSGGDCSPCPADFNQDGGVDGGDVEAFFIAWEASESCGDTNQDGGVDGADVETFFTFWEAGGC